jgi:hypothetical protein
VEKKCIECDVIKPLNAFRVSRARPYLTCKECIYRHQRAAYAINGEKRRAKQNAARAADKDYAKNANLKSKYGITLEEYNMMVELHARKCNICGEVKKLVVDHCHTTGQVRGLLCHQCNCVLGYAKDRFNVLLEAASYLKLREIV